MIKIVFVCMGNICRSPSAEAVMKKLVKEKNFEDRIFCDSAGTIANHEGEPADSRMKIHAEKRGYELDGIARKFVENDFRRFDYIIVMDDYNYQDIVAMDKSMKYYEKISKITDYSSNGYTEVPDPYYGGRAGFELVLDILEDSCRGFLNYIIEEHDL